MPSNIVSPSSPTYPWPSLAVSVVISVLHVSADTVKLFLMDVLFSSPQLRFSEPQKRAVLCWASQLGAQNVPTLYALSQSQERIKNLIGNSVTAVTTGAGNKLYMQDIPYMLAKV